MKTLSTVPPLKYSESDLLSFLLSRADARQSAVALWRLPDTGLTHLIISDTITELTKDDFLEDLDAGFLMAPFDKSKKRLLLKADQIFSFEAGNLKPHDNPLLESSAQWLQEELATYKAEPYRCHGQRTPPPREESKESFIEIVRKGIAAIENGTLEKIVPSRTRTIGLPPDFDIVNAFLKLRNAYPQALISFVSIPGVGSWLGATPELLVSVQDKSVFKTVALAGTLPYEPDIDLRSVAWTQKEIEEQALVERYVISCFKRVRLREYMEYGPRTTVAGNLMHLKSEFTVDMKAMNFPQMGTVMLDLLHPTSAVCGMPLEASLEFIKQHESYERGFYAGYLGPVNIHNKIELFVNIRCMQIMQSQAVLYAGAGVTLDSVPEKEWSETEMKFNTLLNVIY